jgi:hypothetical protein
MADKKFIDSPLTPPASPPADYRGGPGVYGGQPGWPAATPSPNTPAQKIYDIEPPGGSGEIASPAKPPQKG